ncbi:protein POOR HOMOLOGOUS SYNAPSIS 1 [Dioscorea cayenensis subsp. rotundata]|uniref:Protein POOR HOMOLOGOUS SYNAPSIS 1 n=1 Tax=Dioscorea cayennensis subsp. rotundata TaxID=55577 RepID=A0AB40CS86_DIOCR|nr:protein POOR HOMOLOGOUS SYNAPSIS 1 [Dioscorea cayenensis subsp. rotundata]
MAGVSTALESLDDLACTQWEVEYSRFFHFPRQSISSSSPALPEGLRPLPKGKIRSRGTWLTASSTAILLLRTDSTYPIPVLSVILSRAILEEHFVSNLSFSWPQVSCDFDCPIRGSRIVFVSFRDCSNLIQKFAIRFLTSSASESFLNSVKECSSVQASHFFCDSSSLSKPMASNELHRRADEESSLEKSVATCEVEVPALTCNALQHEHPCQPIIPTKTGSVSSGLPRSFSQLLTDCSMDSEKVQTSPTRPTLATNLNCQNGGDSLDPSFLGVERSEEQSKVADLRSQLATCMSDASFVDMLSKIEMVINELGGDLSL